MSRNIGPESTSAKLGRRIEELEATVRGLGNAHHDEIQIRTKYTELQRKYEALVDGLNGCLDRWKKRQSRPWQPCAQPETLVQELRALLEKDDE